MIGRALSIGRLGVARAAGQSARRRAVIAPRNGAGRFGAPLGSKLQQVRGFCLPQLGEQDTKLVMQILRKVHGTRSIEFYLKRFRSSTAPAFCVIKVGGDVVEYELDDLTETCATLSKLGLLPVVIHGGGPQMNDELKKQGIEPEYVNGSRVTDEATLSVAERIFTQLNGRVVDSLKNSGVKARGFPNGVFQGKIADPQMGFVGSITGVDSTKIREALANGEIPVLTSLGQVPETGQVLNINADVACRDMVIDLKPMRVLFASYKGGWLDEHTNKILGHVNLANDYDEMASYDYTGRQGTLLKLNEIKEILDNVPDSTSVSITAAGKMLKELFSDEGAGTIFVKGSQVVTSTEKGKDLVYDGDILDKTFSYGDDEETFAQVVYKPLLGKDLPPVIDRFVVDDKGYGLGHSDAIWKKLKSEYKSLAWVHPINETAAREEDPNNVLLWSENRADGTIYDRERGVAISFCNNDHPLLGWNFDNAKRLAVEVPLEEDKPKFESAPLPPMVEKPFKIGLLGARGYVGREFVKLVMRNPNMELTVASSRALKGQSVINCFGLDPAANEHGISKDLEFKALEPEDLENDPASKDVDVWVLALPNGLAPNFVPHLEKLKPGNIMIDLGADYRFTDDWTYGIPERPGARDKLKHAKRISNPGCYATGAQIGLMPLVQPNQSEVTANKDIAPSVFGLSGYSGAGTNPSDKNDPRVLKDSVLPYALVNHIHEREASRHLGSQIAFMPHVAPYFQGIHLTCTAYLNKKSDGTYPTAEEVKQVYTDFFKDEPLIKVVDEPNVRDVMFKHHVAVGNFTVDPNTGRIVIVSAIDNLMKGAATQALQNLNLALGVDEYAGLD